VLMQIEHCNSWKYYNQYRNTLDNCPNFQLLVIKKVRVTRVFVISLGYRLYLPGLCC